jgi:hypothetical protein
LERFDPVSINREECFGLLDEMIRLAKYIKQLKERPQLREEMEDLIQKALEMKVKATIMCGFQIILSMISTQVLNDLMTTFMFQLQPSYQVIQ